MVAVSSVWHLQDSLRKNSLLIPAILLLLASLVVVWHHFTLKEGDDTTMRGFLLLVMISMAPLAYVDAKIGSCADPVGLFCKFGHKVVVIHVIFLTLRCYARLSIGDTFVTYINFYGLIVCGIALAIGFRVQATNLAENIDVLSMFALAVFAAVSTEAITNFLSLFHFMSEFYKPDVLSAIIGAAGEYVEILSFLPPAWMIFRHEKKEGAAVDPEEFKLKALCFSGMSLAFYMVEDVITAVLSFQFSWSEAFAHMLHFLLLADFCGYILGIAYNPNSKTNGTFLQRLGGQYVLDQFV